jgi:hypothetical protein
MAFRDGLLDQQVAAPLINRECSRYEQQNQDEYEAEESPGAHWSRFSTGAPRISKGL